MAFLNNENIICNVSFVQQILITLVLVGLLSLMMVQSKLKILSLHCIEHKSPGRYFSASCCIHVVKICKKGYF